MPPVKVLYVEDDDKVRETSKAAMELDNKLSVSDFSSGEEALSNLMSVMPEIVILDVKMPELSGPEVLKKLRQIPHGRNLPVIFLTSHVDVRSVEDYYDDGVLGVIPKPFDPLTLADNILSLFKADRVIDNYRKFSK